MFLTFFWYVFDIFDWTSFFLRCHDAAGFFHPSRRNCREITHKLHHRWQLRAAGGAYLACHRPFFNICLTVFLRFFAAFLGIFKPSRGILERLSASYRRLEAVLGRPGAFPGEVLLDTSSFFHKPKGTNSLVIRLIYWTAIKTLLTLLFSMESNYLSQWQCRDNNN